jgi:Lysozyme like domain
MASPQIKTPVGPAPVAAVVLLGVGGWLCFYAIHWWNQGGWPTTPIKDVLQGKGLPSNATKPESAQAVFTGDVQTAVTAGAAADAALAAGTAAGTSPNVNTTGTGTGGVSTGGLSASQIEALWTSNGGDSATAAMAAAVAAAESGGVTNATSANPGGPGCTNVGLWQLATPCGVGAGYTVAQLEDATTNCRITIMATANGTNWSSWDDPVVNQLPGGKYVPGAAVPDSSILGNLVG